MGFSFGDAAYSDSCLSNGKVVKCFLCIVLQKLLHVCSATVYFDTVVWPQHLVCSIWFTVEAQIMIAIHSNLSIAPKFFQVFPYEVFCQSTT